MGVAGSGAVRVGARGRGVRQGQGAGREVRRGEGTNGWGGGVSGEGRGGVG